MELNLPRLAVLGNPDGYYVQDLQRAAGDETEITVVDFDSLAASLTRGEWNCWDRQVNRIQEYELVLVRTMPWGSLEQIIFRVDLLHRLAESGVRVINSASSLEVAIDKFRTLSVLQQAGLPVPATYCCQTVDHAMDAFQALGGSAVVKPMFGGEGRGVMRLDDAELASRAFKTLVQLNALIYLQEYVPHPGSDIRVLVVGEEAWTVRRHHANDWRTNVSRGGRAQRIDPEPEWLQFARTACDAVGAWMAGVDLLEDDSGQVHVLEVNAVPGWKGLAEAHQVDIAAAVLSGLRHFTSSAAS